MSALPSTGRLPGTARRPAPARRSAASRRPRLRVVEAPRHTGRYAALLLLVGALGVFGIVALNALAAEQAFAARALGAEVGLLEIRYDELTAEVAALESPTRVRQVAEELGMVPADRPAFLNAERSIAEDGAGGGVLASASGFADGAVADPVKAVLSVGR